MTTPEDDQEQMDYLRGYRDGLFAIRLRRGFMDVLLTACSFAAGALVGWLA